MSALQPGDRIVHRERGPGRLLALRPGARARVRLDDEPGFVWTVPLSELMLAAGKEWVADHSEPGAPVWRPAKGARAEQSARGADEHDDVRSGAAGATAPTRASGAGAASAMHERAPEGGAQGAAAATSAAKAPPSGGTSSPSPGGATTGGVALREGAATAAAALPRETDVAVLASLRQAIEALRLGVVPAEHVAEYTVGREPQLGRIDELLEAGGGLRVVWGDYGAGKTHLLDIAEELGRRAGWMTARIVLDPREVPPTHPKRLYSALVEHLRYPSDLAHGLEPLFQRLARSDEHALPGGAAYSRFYSPFLYALEADAPDLLDWLRDYVDGCYMDMPDGNAQLRRSGWHGDSLLTLSDFRTYGRMYVHLLGTVAAWARDAGFGGLLLLFDEVEFVDTLGHQELEYALEVLKHFAAVTVPREDVGFDPDELYKGGHQVHRELPLRFRDDQPLSVVFALTPLEDIRELFRGILRAESYELEVTPLRRADCEELARKVVALYSRAYPGYEPDAAARDELFDELRRSLDAGEDAPRAIVRACVYWLDRDRLARRAEAGSA